MDFNEFIEELFRRTDLVRIVSRYTPLNRRGGTYWGCCPFHHEKTPSFTVSPDRGLYYCFGCHAGGNAISFVSGIESVDRMEAIRILAKEAGMEVPQTKRGSNVDYEKEAKKRERLYALMREAARHYHENLSGPDAQEARAYLEGRKVPQEMVTRFGLGYSVSGGEMPAYLSKLGYSYAEMKEAGLIAQRADEYYDVFYGRLLFPIINAMGEVVSFGGRVLKKNPDFAKYRNGSQTPIFDKSKNIFAVNLLKKKRQREGVPYVIMCEGYMDVLSLHQAGFDTAVASMSTMLTNAQAKLLKRYSDRIYISYDGDAAGQEATLRGLDILAEAGFNVKVVCLPPPMDPDDVIKAYGREGYQKLLDEAITLTAFKIKTIEAKYDLTRPDEKAKFAVEAARVVKALENPVEQEEYLKQLHAVTGYTMDALQKQMGKAAPEKETVYEPPQKAPQARAVDKSLEFILASILAQKPFCDYTLDLFPYLPDDFSRRVYGWGLKRFKEGGGPAGMAAFYDETPEEERPLLMELEHYEFVDGDDGKKFASCAKALATKQLTEQKNEIAKAFDSTHDIALLGKLQEIDRTLKALHKGEDE